MLNFAVADFLQQDPVRRWTPVLFKTVIFHDYLFGKHHRHAGAIVAKGVSGVNVIIRKHEVQSIPDVRVTYISAYNRICYEFEINAVAMAGGIIVFNKCMTALP